MAIRINLDLDTLRTLVIAHDRGGLAQAAEHLGRTPSAISLQMKRLKDWDEFPALENVERLKTNLKGEPIKSPSEAMKYWRTEVGKGANFNYWYSG